MSIIAIYRAELRRFALRRTSRVAAFVAIALTFTVLGMFALTHADVAPDIEAAKAQARVTYEMCVASNEEHEIMEPIAQWCHADYVRFLQDERYQVNSILGGPSNVDTRVQSGTWLETRSIVTTREEFVTQWGIEGGTKSDGLSGDLPAIGGTAERLRRAEDDHHKP